MEKWQVNKKTIYPNILKHRHSNAKPTQVNRRLTFFPSPHILSLLGNQIRGYAHSDPTVWNAALQRERRFLVNFAPKSQYMKGNREGNRRAADQRENRPGFFFCLSLSFWRIRLRGDILPHEEGLLTRRRVAELNGPGHKCFRGKREKLQKETERGQQ